MKQLQIVIGESTASTHVYVDNQAIGWIQEIKIRVGVDSKTPEVEITFPNLEKISSYGAGQVVEQIKLLDNLPHVKVTLKDV